MDYVLKNAPFYSEHDAENDKKPFIGAGYYFWEYNIDYAKVWGKNHYNDSYFIVESEINIENNDDSFYLDLAGNREHLVGFVELLKEFKFIDDKGTDGIDLCHIISYLRDMFPEEVFPYKVIRAVDYKNKATTGIKIAFNEKGSSYTILNPRIIVSYKNKEDIVYNKKPFLKFAK
ncbi:hypothetical protein [Tenacibaculum finnmarkense]|uniref:hypothetical protein n=1 Tax=Tenacibaculum finnmarkense TaxID=2781243 RepID=UPI001EFB7FFC|nr:hypothetical protein [Tenacibaculum finnmarkense]MCG8860075.1 hypothetical protein [Tenacibaculum finnmarkense]